MAWNGPAAGTAQYQQGPFATTQPGLGHQQPYQYGQTSYGNYQGSPPYPPNSQPPRGSDFRPPKKKGNPIITRYPPPPGYRGPGQSQSPYGTNAYHGQNQPAPNQFQPGYSGPPSGHQNSGYPATSSYPQNNGYPHQGYGPPQSYPLNQGFPQQGYPQAPGQNHQQIQQGYPSAQPYSQPQGYQPPQGYAQAPAYNGFPSQTGLIDHHNSQQAMNQQWQQAKGPHYPGNEPPEYNNNQSTQAHPFLTQDPNAAPTPASVQPHNTHATPTPAKLTSASNDGEKPQLFLAWDDWDFDFDGAIWPKSNEPVDPNLSLGVILWRPAKQVTRALASTYDDAEEQALKPPPEKLGNGESVSVYFTCDNSHEAFLDVRQTDEWYRIRKDPIFVVFPKPEDMDLIPIEDCLNNRDRPDWPIETTEDEDKDEDMDDSGWNVMDNLEQALSGQDPDTKPSSSVNDKLTQRDQKQEDVLAMLGVTGSPKPPSGAAVPVTLTSATERKVSVPLPEKPAVPPMPPIPPRPEHPLAPQRAHSYGGHRNSTYGPPPQRPYGSMSSSPNHVRPPPPPPPEQQTWSHPHGQRSGYSFDRVQVSPAWSEASNRTLAGSDFEGEINAEPAGNGSDAAPKLHRRDNSFSRKRSYDDAEQDEKLRQQDEHTRRKRRQPEVAAAYSRR